MVLTCLAVMSTLAGCRNHNLGIRNLKHHTQIRSSYPINCIWKLSSIWNMCLKLQYLPATAVNTWHVPKKGDTHEEATKTNSDCYSKPRASKSRTWNDLSINHSFKHNEARPISLLGYSKQARTLVLVTNDAPSSVSYPFCAKTIVTRPDTPQRGQLAADTVVISPAKISKHHI